MIEYVVKVKEVLQQVEWSKWSNNLARCPVCNGPKKKHINKCSLESLLKDTEFIIKVQLIYKCNICGRTTNQPPSNKFCRKFLFLDGSICPGIFLEIA